MKANLYKSRKSSRKKNNLGFLTIFVLVILGALMVLPNKSKAPDNKETVSSTKTPAIVDKTETLSDSLVWPEDQIVEAKVLMYHHVGPLPDNADDTRRGLTVSAENFESQLKYLKDNNYIISTLKELYEMISRGEDVSRVIVLTFDDGYSDNFDYAWDTMQKYDVKGTFFIISGKIGQNEYMSEQQIKNLSSFGNEIGSHTVNHPSMKNLSPDQARSELSDSKNALEELSGQSIISFCYPAGKYTDETKLIADEVGYKIAVTTQKGKPFSTNEPFEIPRYRINPTTNLESSFK